MFIPRQRVHFSFLNLGHFLDHFFVLIFATVAALALATEWGMSYAELIPYATPGFVAFGVCAIPAGWLADRWSREGMLAVFFIGIGAVTVLTAFATTPLQLGFGLLMLGVFASIYHPVGLAMVVHNQRRTGMALAVNGVFGNLGVACAALVTGALIEWLGWRWAFAVPGIVTMGIGVAYVAFVRATPRARLYPPPCAHAASRDENHHLIARQSIIRVFGVVLVTTSIGGLAFQATTFALPKVFDERLAEFGLSAAGIGFWAFTALAVAGFAQLVVGHLVDRTPLPTLFASIMALQTVLFAVAVGLGGAGAVVVAVCYMLLVFGQNPINDFMIGRVSHSGWISRAFAVRSAITFLVTAGSIPLIAWLHHNWGFGGMFTVLASLSVVCLGAVLCLPRITQLNVKLR